MTISYNKLFKILIDRRIKKKQLAFGSGVSVATITKLGNNENVNVDILCKICVYLGCTLDDIVDIIPSAPQSVEPIL